MRMDVSVVSDYCSVYVKVAEDDEPPIELPLESDNTILLTTIQAQFPKSTGLQYRCEDTGILRGIRLTDGRLFPPPEGWSDSTFYCVTPKDSKRRFAENGNITNTKTPKLEGKKCTDLIVLNLSWQTDESNLKKYFSKYGEVVMTQVKREQGSRNSRGYGFVRFAEYQAQLHCLAENHHIDGRWCEVKIPRSKTEGDKQDINRKVYVGNISESTTSDRLREFFSSFGPVSEVFIPVPFRAFAFVTFEDASVASEVLGKEYSLDNKTVNVGSAVPKPQLKWNSRKPSRRSALHPAYDWLPPRQLQREDFHAYADYQGLPPNYGGYFYNLPHHASIHSDYTSPRPPAPPYPRGYYSQTY